ncbi:hypothetical protein VaNZ11_012014 [Volvox africanus]|uniref:Uncharacterized protein n=1 Tax=Volvox africanus TaxID=51714 RepID=A0ABQ5SE89_9CHLO|nr:hypothetical protein VaNZ11_012014 [Volvox africanus]
MTRDLAATRPAPNLPGAPCLLLRYGPICGGYRRDGCHGMWKRFLAALYNGSGDVGFGGKDGATSGHADHTRVSASVPGVESIISRTEFDSGSALDWNGKQNPPPTWVQSGDLRLAGAWGCVGASFMAEERGVPLMRVADFQDRASARLKSLLPRVGRVKLHMAVNRDATCQVVAAMPLGRRCLRIDDGLRNVQVRYWKCCEKGSYST